ncbi:MAG: enoyl-CoA hydratase/isomerase family protein [Candidatus Bathyarchaeota archaeon]|nr:MAG: enoyl-CoA hydratase/isomerase family protein [Candidatus Bathyarchaeota archaeon]
MKFENTLCEKSEGIATITINRPQALNALNEETLKEISSRIADARQDENIKVLVITGAGDRAFCAGADLNMMKGKGVYKGMHLSQTGQKLTLEIEELGKPVIAAINGYTLGGGLELAMACDLRIASENAQFGQPEINVGLIPGWGGTQRLPRLVGKGKAKEMILTGKRIDAETAEQLGLVSKVVPLDQLKSTVKELASELMNKPPIAIELSKQLINNSTEIDLRMGLVNEAEAFGILASTEDFREGVKAFLEKRKPQYKGK